MPQPKPRRRLAAQDRKDSIARAALPLFARKGLDGVTTRELAAACGVSEALLFRHFPTKEAMFHEILHQYRDLVTTESEQLDRLPPPSTGALVQLVFMFMRRVVIREPKTGKETMLFFYRSFTEDGTFARRFLGAVKDLRECFEANVAAARAAGDLLALTTPAHNLFWFVQHIGTAACLIRLPDRPAIRYEGSLEEAVEQMVHFVLRGMGMTESALKRYASREQFAQWR